VPALLADLTTLRLGGPAARLVTASSAGGTVGSGRAPAGDAVPEAACDETIEEIGDARGNQACPDDATVAEQRKYPDDGDEEYPQPGHGIGDPPGLLLHERSLACGSYR